MAERHFEAAAPLTEVVRTNIRAEAARREINQSDIAAYMGWTKSMVNKRFLGGMPWKLEELQPMADLLRVSVVDLVTPPEGRKLPRLDSNQEPADYRYAVVSLDAYRAAKAVA